MKTVERAAKAGIPYGRLTDPALEVFARDCEKQGYYRGHREGFKEGWLAARENLPTFLRRWIDPDGFDA